MITKHSHDRRCSTTPLGLTIALVRSGYFSLHYYPLPLTLTGLILFVALRLRERR